MKYLKVFATSAVVYGVCVLFVPGYDPATGLLPHSWLPTLIPIVAFVVGCAIAVGFISLWLWERDER